MNIDHLTDDELLRYLLNLGEGPVETRIAKILTKYSDLLEDLKYAGMDNDGLFDNTYELREYVHHLQNEVEYYQNELSDAQGQIERLESRTIIDFMAAMQEKQDNVERQLNQSQRHLRETTAELEKTKSKLKMWSTLNASPKELA